jgi:TetR/AcrR family transcriptional repressor of nem operon
MMAIAIFSACEAGAIMKVSKEKAAENRAALISTAARLFRERGIDGVGVAEIGREAGLTHGALYAHFPSKEALAAEALAYGIERNSAAISAANLHDDLALALDHYLSAPHRDDIATGCALAASAGEVPRQEESVSACFSDGIARMVARVEALLDAPGSRKHRHARALTMVSAMIGGLIIARGASKASPELSDDILASVRHVVGELGGAPVKKPASRPARSNTGTGNKAA